MLVYVLAIGAALLFGVASVIQQRAASEAPPGKSLRLGLLLYLARQRLWLLGVLTSIAGNGLSATALGLGSVALVQPLLVTRLMFALPLAAAWARQRVPRRDWFGVVATAAGLGIFIVAGRPTAGTSQEPSLWVWGLTFGVIAGVVGLLVSVSSRFGPSRRAPLLGAGAGILFGLQAGLTHTALDHLSSDGLVGLLTTWSTYTVAVTAVLGTLLAQSAYEMAPLTASYPALASIEPITGIGLGVAVLGGGLRLGPLPLGVAVVGLVVMSAGIRLLASSPRVTGQRELTERRYEEGAAVRVGDRLARDLDRLEADLHRVSGALDEHHDSRLRRRLQRELVAVDEELVQLDNQLRELTDQSRAELASVRKGGPGQRDELARLQRALDAQQAVIDDRAGPLRQRALELKRVSVRPLDRGARSESPS